MSATTTNQPWEQLCLFERDVLEFTFTVGVERNGNDSFVTAQIRDPRDGSLVALQSAGRRDSRDLPLVATQMWTEMYEKLLAHVWPFPENRDPVEGKPWYNV